jgi:hypothetical protein
LEIYTVDPWEYVCVLEEVRGSGRHSRDTVTEQLKGSQTPLDMDHGRSVTPVQYEGKTGT